MPVKPSKWWNLVKKRDIAQKLFLEPYKPKFGDTFIFEVNFNETLTFPNLSHSKNYRIDPDFQSDHMILRVYLKQLKKSPTRARFDKRQQNHPRGIAISSKQALKSKFRCETNQCFIEIDLKNERIIKCWLIGFKKQFLGNITFF